MAKVLNRTLSHSTQAVFRVVPMKVAEKQSEQSQ